jgi:hypothetical protein
MCKTFMSPDFLTKIFEYREFPVLWQVRSVDYSNRAKRGEAWDLHTQFTRKKWCFIKLRRLSRNFMKVGIAYASMWDYMLCA